MRIWENIEKIIKEQREILKDMTTLASTVVKTGKKAGVITTTAMASPVVQKMVEGLAKGEKAAATPSLQSVQSTLDVIQETMLQMQEKMLGNHAELKTDFKVMDQKIDEIQGAIQSNAEKIRVVEERVEQQEKKLDTVDQRLRAQNKDLEDSMVQMEMERASFYLRFQNILEEREEDIIQIMAGIIADTLQQDKEDMEREIDEAYRVQTSYARRNRLPREVHVRFARKRIRDDLYHTVRDNPIIYREKEIITLKQIPRRVREGRKGYRPLAIQLNRRNIPFRWLIPEGMLISWQEDKVKVDTLAASQEFLDQLLSKEEEESSKEELEQNSQEEGTNKRKKEKEGKKTRAKQY